MNKYRKNFYTLGLSVLTSHTTLFAEENSSLSTLVTKSAQEKMDIVDRMSEYGTLIASSLYFIIIGMLIIYLIHTLISKFLSPRIKNKRIVKVSMGALYALILIVSILMVLERLGFDTGNLGKISLLSVLMVSIIVFYVLPFLPRLPFKIGHMVEINGIVGIVDSITTYHTTIRKFDGTMVFLPNPSIMVSNIMNYSDLPNRQIELSLPIGIRSNVEEIGKLLQAIIKEDKRILNDPAPSVSVSNADEKGINLLVYCWTKNADWAGTRSSLWIEIQKELINNKQIIMSRPKQEIYIMDKQIE